MGPSNSTSIIWRFRSSAGNGSSHIRISFQYKRLSKYYPITITTTTAIVITAANAAASVTVMVLMCDDGGGEVGGCCLKFVTQYNYYLCYCYLFMYNQMLLGI